MAHSDSKHPLAPTRRTFIQTGVAAAASLAVTGCDDGKGGKTSTKGSNINKGAKPYDGVTISGACFQHRYTSLLKSYLPEFEAKTGMQVNLDLPAFPVFNQRADQALATKSGAWDFLGITYIRASRWIGAGWFENLESILADKNMTPPDWGADDFVPTAQAPLLDAKGNRCGFAWEVGLTMMAASRFDLIEKAGFKDLPKTLAELRAVCEAIHDKDGVAAFVNDNLHHWHLPPYLMGYGGDFFKNPPSNLTPTLNTPEAVTAATYYADLLGKFSPKGVLSYTHEQAFLDQLMGKANLRTQSLGWLSVLSKDEQSKVKDTVRYGFMPAGPKGDFPGINSHGWGIPVGSKNREAAWEFIKWALGKEMVRKIAVEKGFVPITRRSVINDEEYRQSLMLNGQDVGAMYAKMTEKTDIDYMNYRTVKVFPQVGDKVNKAIESIVSGSKSAAEALKTAQDQAVADLKKARVKMDL